MFPTHANILYITGLGTFRHLLPVPFCVEKRREGVLIQLQSKHNNETTTQHNKVNKHKQTRQLIQLQSGAGKSADSKRATLSSKPPLGKREISNYSKKKKL